jgi:hypothetical protein
MGGAPALCPGAIDLRRGRLTAKLRRPPRLESGRQALCSWARGQHGACGFRSALPLACCACAVPPRKRPGAEVGKSIKENRLQTTRAPAKGHALRPRRSANAPKGRPGCQRPGAPPHRAPVRWSPERADHLRTVFPFSSGFLLNISALPFFALFQDSIACTEPDSNISACKSLPTNLRMVIPYP